MARKRLHTSRPIESAGARVNVRVRRRGQEWPEPIPAPDISEVLPDRDTLIWVDIRDPGDAEIAMLQEEFDFSPLSLEDVVKERQRPKVDEYPSYYFLVMYAPEASAHKRELITTEVDLFVGQNYVVSLHQGEVPALADAYRRWQNADPEVRDRVGFLAHIVVDAIIDAYFPVVDDIDDRLDAVELTMFRGGRATNSEELLALKRSLFALRKAVYPLKDAFQGFPRRGQSLFDLETHPYFQDVYDHVLRLLDIVDIQRDMISGALDAHLSFMSNSLNETMKVLTVVGICEAAAGAVYGAWGMNVRGIPFQFTRIGGVYVGFWIVMLFTGLLTGLALLWLRRRGMW